MTEEEKISDLILCVAEYIEATQGQDTKMLAIRKTLLALSALAKLKEVD